MAISIAGAVLGIGFAWKSYQNLSKMEALKNQFSFMHRLLENKWYVDEIVEVLIVRPIQKLSNLLWKSFDIALIDRFVLSFGRISTWTGQTIRVIQTGSIQVYAFTLVLGIVVVMGYLAYGWI